MAWLRIDDGFADHPKIVQLGKPEQRWTWLEVLTYCARQRTAGKVPAGINDVIRRATPAFLKRCVAVGLLDEKDGALSVHDWDIYNGETIEQKVASYIATHPDAGSNEIHRAIGGKRELVLNIIKQFRGNQQPVPKPVPGEPPGEPKSGSRSGSLTGTESVHARANPSPTPEETLQSIQQALPRAGPIERLLEVLHDKDPGTKHTITTLGLHHHLAEGDYEYARDCAQGPGVESPTKVAVAALKERAQRKHGIDPT